MCFAERNDCHFVHPRVGWHVWRVRGRALALGGFRSVPRPQLRVEVLWRSGRVYIYRHLRAELLQLARLFFSEEQKWG